MQNFDKAREVASDLLAQALSTRKMLDLPSLSKTEDGGAYKAAVMQALRDMEESIGEIRKLMAE